MSQPGIPENVRLLLATSIETYDQLAMLLLLLERPNEELTAQRVAELLNVSPAAAQSSLEHLGAADLLIASGDANAPRYRYGPGRPELDQAARGLAQAYQDRRVEVMQLMSANAIERVRSGAIRLFADAFLLGRSKKDG